MKKFVLSLLCLSVGTGLFAQTADDIVNKHLDAIGGKNNLLSIKNIYMEGSVDANGQQIQIKSWVVQKKASRQEYTIMGMTGYTIITNDSGWTYNPFEGQKQAEPLTGDMVKRSQVELDAQSSLLNYKDKGYKLEFKGKDDMDGSDAYKLELTVNDSLTETYFIDPSTYYIMRVKTKAKVNGKVDEAQEDFSDYQKGPNGLVFPMSINSAEGQVKFTAVKVNSDIDPALFKPKRG